MRIERFIIVLGVLAAINAAAYFLPVRLDMTDDKHYSLSEATKTMLRQTDEPIRITLLLDGDLNSGFRRLKKATEETIDEMSVYGQFTMHNAQFTIHNSQFTIEIADSLGLNPIVIHEREQNGKTAQTTVYPYALMQYKGKRAVVTLLKNTRGLSGEENLNASIEQLEFAFAEALHLLQQKETPRVAILEGHGEPDEAHTYDLMSALSKYYQVDRGQIEAYPRERFYDRPLDAQSSKALHPKGKGEINPIDAHILDGYEAVIIVNPATAFSDAERFVIDQYIMRGGAVLWAVNGVQFSEQVLQQEGFTPIIATDLGISDMLFRYGVRVNPALVQDIQCLPIPVNVSSDPSQPNLQPMPWTYAPLLLTSQGSPITRNMGQVMSTFVSPVDAVGGEDGIDKRVLLATSTASRVTATPGKVDLDDMNPDVKTFVYQYVPIAVSMEGAFSSAYAHRMVPEGVETDEPIRKTGVKTRQVVIGSGSILLNETQKGQVLPMGYDRYSGMQFSNRDFAVNAVLWLTDSEGIIGLREKSVALRLLNDQRAHLYRAQIQTLSISLPIGILALIGGLVWGIRKHRYEKKNMKVERLERKGLRLSVLLLSILFCAGTQAQEMLNYPLDTINGEEVYVYQVERSIGLYRISVNFNVPQTEIVRLNPQLSERGLHFGETLYLPTGRKVEAKKVERGELRVESRSKVDSLQMIVDSLKRIVEEEKKEVDSLELRVLSPKGHDYLAEPNFERSRLVDSLELKADTLQADTLQPEIMMPDTSKPGSYKVVELALMLPFESHQTKKSTNATRMMEFYQGALLALRAMQNDSTLYRLRVYDTERSERRINALCDSTELDSVRGVLGLVYPIQIERMAAWCDTHEVPLMLPFSDDVDLVNRRQVLQFNSTDQQEADSLFTWITAHDSTTHCIAVDVRDAELAAPIRALRKRIRESEIGYQSVPLHDLMIDSVGYALDSVKENLFILYSDKFQHVRILLPHLSMLQEKGYKVRIISHYAWQKENIDLPQVYTSVFRKEADREEYDNLWEHYYTTNHTSDAPRFDLLGYDLMRALVGWLNGEKETQGLQSVIRWTQVGEGGWQNEEVRVIEN